MPNLGNIKRVWNKLPSGLEKGAERGKRQVPRNTNFSSCNNKITVVAARSSLYVVRSVATKDWLELF